MSLSPRQIATFGFAPTLEPRVVAMRGFSPAAASQRRGVIDMRGTRRKFNDDALIFLLRR
jgi:hypothetical protein